MNKFILALFFLTIPSLTQAQCEVENRAFQTGEKVSYDVTYNWGYFWVTAGDVFFEVSDTVWEGKDYYHFKGYGKSIPRWDWMYKVRDYFDAFVDKESLLPAYFSRDSYEGGYKVDEVYRFDYRAKTILSDIETSKKERITKKVSMEACVYDVLSAVYKTRNIDYSAYKIGEKIPLSLIIDGKVYDIYMRYLGIENYEANSGKVYECIKFAPYLVEGTMFKGGEDMTVWVTNDQYRIPIQVEAKILVGSVKASVREIKGVY